MLISDFSLPFASNRIFSFLSKNLSRENSSPEIVSSSRALETRSLITLSFLSASNLILWCFSAFSIKRLLTNHPTMKRSPAPSDMASITVTAGEAIMVDKNMTLTVLKPTVAKPLGKPDDKVGRCEWERVGCV